MSGKGQECSSIAYRVKQLSGSADPIAVFLEHYTTLKRRLSCGARKQCRNNDAHETQGWLTFGQRGPVCSNSLLAKMI